MDPLASLAQRRPIGCATAVIVAHPDDETIAAGASLHLCCELTLVHITDGAPRDGQDARAHGFATIADYAAARRAELHAALRVAGIAPATIALDVPDQAASHRMAELVDRIGDVLADRAIELVLTHAYEGGHPDHDATCLAVHAASGRLARRPRIIEAPLYHAWDGQMVTGAFVAGGAAPVVIPLTQAEQDCKRDMLACFTTQRAMLGAFGATHEVFREAQPPDFSRPPHPGALFYEQFPWGIGGQDWRAQARAVLEAQA